MDTPQLQNVLHLFLIGGPGVGKGTLIKELRNRFETMHDPDSGLITPVSVLPMSAELSKEMDLQPFIESGGYVDDEIVIRVWNKARHECTTPIIIHDGYPRTDEQVQAVRNANLAGQNQMCLFIIMNNVSDEVMENRMLRRERPGETLAAIRRRIEIHHKTFEPMVQEIHKTFPEGSFVQRREVDASRRPEEISNVTWATISGLLLANSAVQRHFPLFVT